MNLSLNALIHESSPYLLQHAHNPVDWQPWSDKAWETARAEDKLVIVSIGYSACHWCHVMERETFEDSSAAAFMNQHFLNIKVDREERPDVDGVYMTAVQLMTKSGGWPLNVICLPDGRPIYGGTYFPCERWMQALRAVLATREQNPARVEEYAAQLTAGVEASAVIDIPPLRGAKAWGTPDAFGDADRQLLTDGIERWKGDWDPVWGGNNRAPKFPLPTNLDFLLHYGTVRRDEQALQHVRTTLLRMAHGGIHDLIGGGFARYSVDEKWHVPHFEKMLYDNAQLAATYARAWQAFTDIPDSERAAFRRAALGIVAFVEREWSHASGGFFSALDADSEGVEGKYYVWTRAELEEVLTADEFELVQTVYAIDGRSLWEEEMPRANVLMQWDAFEALEQELCATAEDITTQLQSVHDKLLVVLSQRAAPGCDTKILTAWTALMASGLTATGSVFDRSEDLERARKALDFILETQRGADGRLRHVYHESSGPRIDGMLDDYGCTITALLDYYQATFDTKYALAAAELTEQALADFYDNAQGTFWFQRQNGETLFARKQENDDSVIPSANAQMARGLFQLSLLFDRPEWRIMSDRMLAGALDRTDYWPSATHWGGLLLWRTERFREVVIAAANVDEVNDARQTLQRVHRPQVLWAGGVDAEVPILRGKIYNSLSVFLCQNNVCELPQSDLGKAHKVLDNFGID